MMIYRGRRKRVALTDPPRTDGLWVVVFWAVVLSTIGLTYALLLWVEVSPWR